MKHEKTPFIRARSHLKRTLFGVGVFSFFLNLLMLTGPIYMLQVYDRVITSGSLPTLGALTLIIIVLYTAYGLLDWVRQRLFSEGASRLEHALAPDTARLSIEAQLTNQAYQSDVVMRDLRQVRRFLNSPSFAALFDVIWTPLFFALLFALHWWFGVFAICATAILVLATWLNQASSKKRLLDAEVSEAVAQRHATEIKQNAELIQALGMREQVSDRWRAVMGQSDQSMRKSLGRSASFVSFTKSLRLFFQSAILGLGGLLVIFGEASAGAMVAASIVLGRAVAPIVQLISSWHQIVTARESWKNLSETLAETHQPNEPMELQQIFGAVVLENVYAAPPGIKKAVLNDVSFQIEPGDALGVIGPSAAGKSTLAKVMVGVWRPIGGTVRIDGAALDQWDQQVLGRQLGYLPQQAELLRGTVAENIARFDPETASRDIIDAAKAAGCHNLILKLPQGYETEVGEGGTNLSAGQRQRVALARALFGEPNLIILDEPNSNLDSDGDAALQDAIRALRARKATVLIIAHRPNAVLNCNKILILKDGQVADFGNKEDVLTVVSGGANNAQVTLVRPKSSTNAS
ncbi:MAG: type I secretion system permease/ATPase [Pseudomonadota bacterium]